MTERSFQNDASPSGCDRRGRVKDAGSVVAALRTRLRTKDRSAQRGLGGRASILKRLPQLPNSSSRGRHTICRWWSAAKGDRAIDIAKLRTPPATSLSTRATSTRVCRSAITFIDGEKGVLRYRGIPIQQLARNSTFVETCWLLITGASHPGAAEDLEQSFTKFEISTRGSITISTAFRPPATRWPYCRR